MIRRLLVLAFLGWNLLALPSLCGAGALEHPCECAWSDQCGHEQSCASDPCSFARPSNDSPAWQTFGFAQSILAVQPLELTPAWTILVAPRLDSRPLPLLPALSTGARPLLA
jgi:hypothetical protein